MKHFHVKRMLKLCDFLDQLPRKQFDFSMVGVKDQCGTVGCAIGWTPTVFPRLVKAVYFGTWSGKLNMEVAMKTGGHADYVDVASQLFGISHIEASALFSPKESLYSDDYPSEKILSELPETATPKQVSKRLRRFLKWKTKQTQSV